MIKQYNNSIQFLGTGTSQGVPVIACKCKVCMSNNLKDRRFRSSAYVLFNNKTYVIDVSPDFRIQFLTNNLENLDAVLFTHEHKDHTGGVDDLRAINFMHHKSLPLFGQKRVLDEIKQAYAYAFTAKKYPGTPMLDLYTLEAGKHVIEENTIVAIEVMHGELPILGYRFGDLAYITDANFIPETSKNKLKNLDVLVLNALRVEPHHSHFTLNEALEVFEELKPKQMYLTHISHLLGDHEAVQQILPENVHLAYDGLKVSF